MLGRGGYPLENIHPPITFRTLEHFCTKTLCFEVASFDYVYIAIVGRPELAKFMAISHY